MPPPAKAGGIPRPQGLTPRTLGELAAEVGGTVDAGAADVRVSGITGSSALVRPGDLFAALPGRSAHGAAYAPAALDAGAVAVLTDTAGRDALPAGTPVLVVPEVRPVLGAVAAAVYDTPSRGLRMLGVTGTSGKTTTTFLMRAGLAAAGRVNGLIGTVATIVGDDEISTGFTTPEAPEMQSLLAVMRERGVTDVAMEVSSHALAMGRVGGIGYDVAGFTNLSEDHLDFHADMEDYFEAKALLFGPTTARSVIVVDDEWGQRLARRVAGAVTVSTTDAAADVAGRRRRRAGRRQHQLPRRRPDGVVPDRLRHPRPLQRRQRRARPRRAARRRGAGRGRRTGRRGRRRARAHGTRRRRPAVPRRRRLQPQARGGRRGAARAAPADQGPARRRARLRR